MRVNIIRRVRAPIIILNASCYVSPTNTYTRRTIKYIILYRPYDGGYRIARAGIRIAVRDCTGDIFMIFRFMTLYSYPFLRREFLGPIISHVNIPVCGRIIHVLRRPKEFKEVEDEPCTYSNKICTYYYFFIFIFMDSGE